MNRRTFIQTATVGATSLAGWTTNCPIACINCAWTQWGYGDTFDGIATAGNNLTGLLSVHKGEAFKSPAAMPEYLEGLRKRSAQRGLTAVNLTVIRFRPDVALAEKIIDLRHQALAGDDPVDAVSVAGGAGA